MTIRCYRGGGSHPWRWTLVARNGKTIADSAEGYARRAELKKAVARVVRGVRGRLRVVGP